jgi:hypothetical protein
MAIADKHSNLVAGWMFSAPQVESLWKEAFALGAATEREACAKLCEDEISRIKPIYSVTAENCAKAIRARGEK